VRLEQDAELPQLVLVAGGEDESHATQAIPGPAGARMKKPSHPAAPGGCMEDDYK
jgi:hypothetical protein